mmetsp:Transcript_4715/g.16044  ORF Transcript_4715/g.16044 Transcript_4715/m.16044 type:complete len:202 (-) Transcript_4715:64-669(-)
MTVDARRWSWPSGLGFEPLGGPPWWMRLWFALSRRRTQSLRPLDSSWRRSFSPFSKTSGSHMIDSSSSSGSSAGTSSLSVWRSRATLPWSLSTFMSVAHCVAKLSFMFTESPSLMTNIISGVNTNFVFSRLMPVPLIFLKWPRTCPKSMWKSRPSVLSMMLPLCRSAMPKTYVETQHAAHDAQNRSCAPWYIFGSSLCSTR